MNRLYKAKELAEHAQVSLSTIYAMVEAGLLPHVRIGVGRGVLRFPEDALRSLLEGAREEPKYIPKHIKTVK